MTDRRRIVSVATRTVRAGNIQTTVPNVVVGAGCSINQLIDDQRPWRNHGQFVKHVNQLRVHLTDTGVITAGQAQEITNAAARSNVGKR